MLFNLENKLQIVELLGRDVIESSSSSLSLSNLLYSKTLFSEKFIADAPKAELLHALGTQPVPSGQLDSNWNGAACVVSWLRHVGVGTPHGPVRGVGRGRSFSCTSRSSKRLAHLATGSEERKHGRPGRNTAAPRVLSQSHEGNETAARGLHSSPAIFTAIFKLVKS